MLSLGGAVEAFFANRDLAPATRRTYRQALTPFVEALSRVRPVSGLNPELVAALFAERWDGCAPATWNTQRTAVQAFAAWCRERWSMDGDLLAAVEPRRRATDNTRAIPYADLVELWRCRGVPLRAKTLWRILYETAARASEVLALDVEDLDRPRRRARIRSKGGSTDMVVWAASDRPPLGPLPHRPHRRTAVPDPVENPHLPTAPGPLYTDRPSTADLPDRRGGVPKAFGVGGPCTSCAIRLLDVSGRGGNVRCHAAGEEPAPVSAYPVYVRPGGEAVARLTADQFDRTVR